MPGDCSVPTAMPRTRRCAERRSKLKPWVCDNTHGGRTRCKPRNLTAPSERSTGGVRSRARRIAGTHGIPRYPIHIESMAARSRGDTRMRPRTCTLRLPMPSAQPSQPPADCTGIAPPHGGDGRPGTLRASTPLRRPATAPPRRAMLRRAATRMKLIRSCSSTRGRVRPETCWRLADSGR